LRDDVVASVNACVEKKDCATVLAGHAASACFDEAVASVAPTSAGQGFCGAWETAEKKCGYTLDKAGCLDLSKIYTDEGLHVNLLSGGASVTTEQVVQQGRALVGISGTSATNSVRLRARTGR
jgi:hypothetical protein